MQQIAEYSLWFLLGAIGFTAGWMFIDEYRLSRRLAKEAQSRHPATYDYGRLDHLDGLAYRESEKP